MKSMKRIAKGGKTLFAGMLSVAMIVQSVPVMATENEEAGEKLPEVVTESTQEVTAEPTPEVKTEATPQVTTEPTPEVTAEPTPEETEQQENAESENSERKAEFTEEQLAANDYVLYLANCGTPENGKVPSGAHQGLYQSNVDQAYGPDEAVGYQWGYLPDDEYTVRVAGGASDSLMGSYAYVADKGCTYTEGKSGLGYNFELPEDTYKVTVGLNNPWSKWGTKYEDVLIEGQTVTSKQEAKDFTGEYEVEVTDGELNVFVQATPGTRKDKNGDPVLNYIIVRAIPEGEVSALEVLQEQINSYKDKVGDGSNYSEETLKVFYEAIAAAEKLIQEQSADKEAIEQAAKAIQEAYENLFELHKETYSSISGVDGAQMYDTNGYKIQAHGGQVQKIGDTWYWIGEDRSNGYTPMPGIHMYSSQDLYNWKDEGVVLKTAESWEEFTTDPYFTSLYGGLSEEEKKDIYYDLWKPGCVMERPKMLYNDKTGKYVIWFHADGKTPESTGDSNYAKAKAGIAISDNVNGPYKLLGSYMLASDYDNHGFDSVGGHVRDMNVFKDDDGTGYVMYSSEGNAVMYIAKMNDSYTGLAKPAEEMVLGEDFCISSTDSREAPAMFKYDGKYYLITSGCTGWNPNQARYAVADSSLGPWKNMGDPCVGEESGTTFRTQSTCVIPVDPENGKYIYMGDRWLNPDNGGDLSDSRYVWLPIEFGSNDEIVLKRYSNWTLDELDNKGKVTLQTQLPEETSSVSELMKELPAAVNVKFGGKDYTDTPITWKLDETDAALGNEILGNVSITGTLTELNKDITLQVFSCPSGLTYFADCYTNTDGNDSEVHKKFAAGADNLLNTVSDQAYGADAGINWGYTSTPGASGGGDSQDMGSKGTGDFYNTGWWATSKGSIEYSFEVEPGNYVVSTGHQEWWSSTRGIKVTVTSVDGEGKETEIGTSTYTMSGEQKLQKQTKVTVPEDSNHILVTVSKASGSDPVLSWIGIIKTDQTAPETGDNLLVNGSFENGTDGWNLGAGASVLEGENCPDGTHYLEDNGNIYDWGDGSNQEVSVEPNTEYVLTGNIKVSGNKVYYAGVNVDGKEIYCVASTDSNYTDTTNTDKKQAYQVAAGATDWMPFEIRFTTPENINTVKMYTWAENGAKGYLDHLELKEVSGALDWTEFDKMMEEIRQLQGSEYTPESWQTFQKVVKEAEDFKANATEKTKQREIRLMIVKLQNAMEDLISIHEPTGDTTYYVDAANGDDNNDGTTPETAWRTLAKASSVRKLTEGGSILLRAGCVWNGEQLTIKNAEGTAEHPVVIGSYGEGAKPVINGNGAGWQAERKEELAAVHVVNSENIIIENLEITNWDSSVEGEYTQSSKLLSGLVVENRDAGELTNVVIRNNKIHDVNGLMRGGAEKAAGGLIVVVTGEGKNHTGLVESWFNGLTIEGNEVADVCHEAIYMESVWASRKLVGGSSSDTGYQNAGNGKWIGSSNVVIENNYVHDVAGDGIVPINTKDALVQYNLIDNAAESKWDYSANPNHAALWSWDADNVTFRYNEACNSSKNSVGTAVGNDSMAFDFDYGVQNCLYEYNYSHDNLGGFLMLCPGPGATVNNIARYNVSVNDGLYDGAPMIRMGTGKYGSVGVQVYNNTMYWAETGYSASLTPDSYWEGPVISEVSVFNNIFYGPAKEGSVSTKEGISYYNNCVYGGSEIVYGASANDDTMIAADPLFTDVKDHTAGSWTDGKTTLGTVNGFKLQKDSPCINAGAEHPDAPNVQVESLKGELVENTTAKPGKDYYGTALSDGKIDIGASEYAEKPVVTVDKNELKKQIEIAEATDETKYTEDSYGTMKTALDQAKAVYKNEKATQAQVDEAAAALKAALNALEEKIPQTDPEKGDKTELEKLYQDTLGKVEKDYTASTWKVFVESQKAAAEVLAKEDATKEEILEAYNNLAAAVNGLKKVHVVSGGNNGNNTGNPNNGNGAAGAGGNGGSSSTGNGSTHAGAGSTTTDSQGAKTGDQTQIAIHVIGVLMAVAVIGILIFVKRRQHNR